VAGGYRFVTPSDTRLVSKETARVLVERGELASTLPKGNRTAPDAPLLLSRVGAVRITGVTLLPARAEMGRRRSTGESNLRLCSGVGSGTLAMLHGDSQNEEEGEGALTLSRSVHAGSTTGVVVSAAMATSRVACGVQAGFTSNVLGSAEAKAEVRGFFKFSAD